MPWLIREMFNTCRPATAGKFAHHKEKVIILLRTVCTVRVRTVEVVRGMEKPYARSQLHDEALRSTDSETVLDSWVIGRCNQPLAMDPTYHTRDQLSSKWSDR